MGLIKFLLWDWWFTIIWWILIFPIKVIQTAVRWGTAGSRKESARIAAAVEKQNELLQQQSKTTP